MRTRFLSVLAACAASLACTKTNTEVVTDYSANFTGVWTGTVTVTESGQPPESYSGSMNISATGVNAVALGGFCGDGSGPPATVPGASTLNVGAGVCPPEDAGGCTVTVAVTGGGAILVNGTLTVIINATMSGCGQSRALTVEFVGTRAQLVAHAGADQTVPRRSPVTLWGTASGVDPGTLLSATWSWEQIAGPPVTLDAPASQMPGFTAPDVECDLKFRLTVTAGGQSASDEVAVLVRNQAPFVSVALTPGLPITTDEIVAAVTAHDPDQDPITLSYEWKRNGSVLPGQTGATLPPGSAVKNDLVTVVVTASDGLAPATAEASVTIQDAPPVLTASPPPRVDAGAALSFQIAASDPDGDPIGALALEYGPAGMQVTPGGLVTWTASIPMFDRSLDVNWAVAIPSSPGARMSGTVRVEDAARQYPLLRSGIEMPVAHSGLVVSDLDGDGRADILVGSPYGLYELAPSGGGYAQRWAYPFSPGGTSPLSAIAAGDADGDGKQEIFVAAGDAVVVLDGATRREIARVRNPGGYACLYLAAADLDRDGSLELACLRETSDYTYPAQAQVVVFDARTLATRWETPGLSGLGGTLAVGNVDGDAALEVVTSGGFVFDGITHANEWAYGPGFGAVVGVGDLDGDGVAEIVGMQSWDTFRGYSAVLKSPIWEMARFNPGALLVADIDGDGRAEVLVGDAQWGSVTAYRYLPATNTLSTIFDMGSQGQVFAIGVGDVDGDGAPEFVWSSEPMNGDFGAYSLVVAGLNPGISVEWMNQGPAQLEGPYVGGIPARLGGGTTRLLFAVARTNNGYDGTRLIALDPATGLFTLSNEVGTNWNNRVALDLADYDRDGVDEVFLATSDLYDGYLTAYDFLANASEWTSPTLGYDAGVAMTHADLNGDGFDDLIAVTTDGYVHAYDVKNQALIWKSTGLGSTGAGVAALDLDGDGGPEIVALAAGRVAIFHRVAGPVGYAEVASFSSFGGAGAVDLVVADCDGDGAPEIYVLATGYSGPSNVTRLDASLAPLGVFTLDAVASSLHVEDLGPGRKNLVVGVGDPWYVSSPQAPHLRAVDPRSGAEVWRSPGLWGSVPPRSLRYVDANGDGSREIAFGNANGMYLTR